MDRVIRNLLRNRDELWKQGVEIPSPRRYRGLFGEAVTALKGGPAPVDMQEMLLDAVMDSDDAARVVLSQEGFIGLPKRAITPNGLYANTHHRMTGLSNLFPDSSVEFFFSILHPARHVQKLVAMHKDDYAAVMEGIDPRQLRWAPMFRRILAVLPNRRIVTWSDEDLPFIWPEVMREIAGVDATMPLQGDDLVLADLLPPKALAALNARIEARPGLGIGARRQMVEEALNAADMMAMEAEIPLPGWSQALIDELSEIYAEDLAEIAGLRGVELISV